MPSTKFSSRENVRVIIRYRPVNKVERSHENDPELKGNSKITKIEPMEWDEKASQIILGKKKNRIWQFDGVAGFTLSQEAMFTIVAEKTCKDIMNGFNGTIFVYGQTGSGKTYTMYGAEDRPEDVQLMGVIPRCVSYIFNEIGSDEDIETFRVTCSFLEIYQEKLRDLLSSQKNQDLKIRLNKRHETYVQGLVEHQVESITDVLQLISIAVGNRVTDSTNMNAVSSRGHMLMKMTVVIKLKDGTIRIAAANFADLAGSEKVKKTGAVGTRLDEAKAINKSLSVLGMVINALSGGKKKHVPFRDSMLTHVLRDSLGGNCKTTLVVTVSPHKYNRIETINSLRFGRRCKLVTNKASVNRVYSNAELMRRLAMLEAKNEELQMMLKQKAYDAFQNTEFPKQIEGLTKEVAELKAKLEATEGENDNLEKIIASLQSEKMELEDKTANDKEQLEILQGKVSELEGVVEQLRNELSKAKQREEYMSNQQALLNDKLEKMTSENESINGQMKELQNEVNNLRQFKYDTQQKNTAMMLKTEEQNNKLTLLKQQLQQQNLQFQQQSTNEKNQTIAVQKELELEQEKIKSLMNEQNKLKTENQDLKTQKKDIAHEKVKYEQELFEKSQSLRQDLRRRSTVTNSPNPNANGKVNVTDMKDDPYAAVVVSQADINAAIAEKEEEWKAEYRAKEEQMVLTFEIDHNEQTRKLEHEFAEKNEKLLADFNRKQQALSEKAEMVREEIKQELTIQIKNETDQELNRKLTDSQAQFGAQLSQLQSTLNEANTRANAMRAEIEEERAKNKELSMADNEKSAKILEVNNDNEQLHNELAQLKRLLAEERGKTEEIARGESEYKQQIDAYEEEKDRVLQEKEELETRLDEERNKIDELKEEFQRKAELFGAKAKEHKDLLHKEKQEKKAIKGQLQEHRGIITKSHHLLAKQNKLLKQRESKIYSLVEKQSTYLDSMANLKKIQVSMDETYTKRLLDEEAEMERKRKEKLEEQARKDEEYVRSLLMQEHNPKSKHGKSGKRSSKSRSKLSNQNNSGDVEQLMQVSNANSKSNLSQQIASVAMAQQRERLMGGKVKKSVLDLWIKSQMQLMCGQLPTLCKKYGVRLNSLNDMYGDKKPDYQPKIDQNHYLKFRSADYDPKEFETPGGDYKIDIANGKGNGVDLSRQFSNPLLEDLDPYGYYNGPNNGKENGMRVAAKPQGFVAQPMSPSLNDNKGGHGNGNNVNDSYALNENLDQNAKKPKKNGKFGLFKRKSKGQNGVKESKAKKKKDKKKKKKRRKDKSSKESTNVIDSPQGGSGHNSPQQMEFENGPAPVPFGQYLKNEDMQQFEKIKMTDNSVELAEEINMDKYRYPNNDQSSNESLEYNSDKQQSFNDFPIKGHASVATNATVITHHSYAQSGTDSREVSISLLNAATISGRNSIKGDTKVSFTPYTESIKCGEMIGIIVSHAFGLINGEPMMRLCLNNQSINSKQISKVKLKINRNYIGVVTTLISVDLGINGNNGFIAFKDKYICHIPLALSANDSIMHSGLMNHSKFDASVEMVLITNLVSVKCKIDRVPLHLFFEENGSLPRDQFLSLWKGIPPSKESKLQISKARSNDMEQIKSLLLMHKLFFIHHRSIPNKGNILYYSCKMYAQVLLCEISIALSGKGTVVVRSSDKYQSDLCGNAIQIVIDTVSSNSD